MVVGGLVGGAATPRTIEKRKDTKLVTHKDCGDIAQACESCLCFLITPVKAVHTFL